MVIFVPTVPIAQPRTRTGVREINGRIMSVVYDDGAHPVNAYKAAVQLAWREKCTDPPVDGPVSVTMTFVLPHAKSRTKQLAKGQPRGTAARLASKRLWHFAKPDLDNLAKSTLDALAGLAFRDDGQVAKLSLVKCWGAEVDQPHVEIQVTKMEQD